MAERRKRGLGRGLGALINTESTNDLSPDTEDSLVVQPVAVEAPAEPTDVTGRVQQRREEFRYAGSIRAESSADEGTTAIDRPTRPVDVFFSAKSHLGTRHVSRGTQASNPEQENRTPLTPGPNSSLEKSPGEKVSEGKRSARRPMPDVLGTSSKIKVGIPVPDRDVTGQGESSDTNTRDSPAPDSAVSRETGDVSGAEFSPISVSRIVPNPRQPRENFDEDDMAELIHSITQVGVLQPIVVRPRDDTDEYEIIMGERRWRASRSAGLDAIPAVIRRTPDNNLLRDALLENIHRSELNPLEEAAAYQQLLKDFDISQESLSQRIGRSRPQISNTLRLLNLPAGIQRRVASGVLSSGHARSLLSLENEAQMEELAQRITSEGLSVRGAEEQASVLRSRSEEAPWTEAPVSRETPRRKLLVDSNRVAEVQNELSDTLDTQVKITQSSRRGRISIEFASAEDLERIFSRIT